MLPSAKDITKKMNYFAFPFMLLILVPDTISLGSCDDFSFSICWMIKDDHFERSGGNIWLNTTALNSVRKQGKFTSLTVSPTVENKLRLHYGGTVHKWTFSISPSTNSIEIRGLQKPQDKPSVTTQEALGLLTPTEVFACENGTLFFHQDENLILIIGNTLRLPVQLESRTPAMLLVSWVENLLPAPDPGAGPSVSLYHVELGSYTLLSVDTATHKHYRFTALESCSPYAACVEMTGAHSLTCLSTITDPDVPKHFQVTSWNNTGITVAWDCPVNRKFSLFLLTAFYLNGTDHVTEETTFWHREERLAFTLSDLPPCSRVRFGLQTVCQAGTDTRYSTMVQTDGNSVHSTIGSLCQTSFGPDNYTLSWEVRNTSSISVFRVYHQGALQGSTLLTSHTVGGLLPCRQYLATVEALCGESIVMDTKTLTAHTGPRGVSDLRYRSNDSTVLWNPGTTDQPAVAFLYTLSFKNGTDVRSSHLAEPELRLPGLVDGLTYAVRVWEQCDGRLQSEAAMVCFDRVNGPVQPRVLPVGGNEDTDPDECTSNPSLCPLNSLCINTPGSYTCVCRHGYYDVVSVTTPLAASRPVCNENGLFVQCLGQRMAGGVAKTYLVSLFGGKVSVQLNHGHCNVDESETLYYFNTSYKAAECGTKWLVNATHIELHNTLVVTSSKDQTITRRDLKIVLKCAYPRKYVRHAEVNADLHWISSLSLVEFSSSLVLGLTMALYDNESYTCRYQRPVSLKLEDTLFLEVSLQTNNTFVSEVVLQVTSCWATESQDPQDPVRGLFLQDGCAVDNTFQWRSDNGVGQKSRFSIRMFTMLKGLPIYFHCLTRICGHDEDCTMDCVTLQHSKTSISKRDVTGKRTAVVSAGPLLVSAEATPGVRPSHWTEHVMMISIVAGSIGFLGITLLGMIATKAVMSYYERLRLQ